TIPHTAATGSRKRYRTLNSGQGISGIFDIRRRHDAISATPVARASCPCLDHDFSSADTGKMPVLQDAAHAPIAVAARFSPDTGQRLVAIRAEAIGADAIAHHLESESFDHRRIAVMAARVFPFADAARQVARIDVLQPRL